MNEERADQYLSFREKIQGKENMDKRNLAIVLRGASENIRTQLLLDTAETLHLPPLYMSNFGAADPFEKFLQSMPPHGFVIADLKENAPEQQVLVKWAANQGMSVHTFCLDGTAKGIEEGDNHQLEQNNLTRSFFQEVSPFVFEDPKLAEKFFQFKDICEKKRIPYIFVAGACSYIYWGRRPLKDLDILVPNQENLRQIGEEIGQTVEHLISAYADTHYLNFSEGVEVISDLKVLYKEGGKQNVIDFSFEELDRDKREVRFMGESCHLMSPEMLVLFKFGLGRFGIDQWGHHKDDYEDANGVLISQNVNLESLRQRAERMGALPRIALGEQILDLS